MIFVSGLDLGQTSDFTALVVAEKVDNLYHFRHLERFQLGTSYTAIVDRVAGMYAVPPLADSTLAVDQTGVGRAVVDLLRVKAQGAVLVPITITAGHDVKEEDGLKIPKKDLVSALQVVLQAGRLKIARGLQHAATLTKELSTFRVKITKAANETFEAWRDGDHDDLVLAVAMAVWVGENRCVGQWQAEATDPEAAASAMSKAPMVW